MKCLRLQLKRENAASNVIVLVFMVVFVFATLPYSLSHPYTLGDEQQRITYVKGTVIEVESEELSRDVYNPDGYTGKQFLKVRLEEGKEKGDVVSITNYLSTTYYVYADVGEKLLISREEGADGGIYYMVYQYYRVRYLYIMGALFAILVIAVGRKKGIKTLLSLAFDFYTLFYFTLPFIYHGYSPVLISILSVIVITAVTLLLLNGWSKKTWSAVFSTAFGVIAAGIVFAVFSGLVHLTGYSSQEADSILVLSHTHGLRIKNVLFAGVLIASLGAVMDVGMSVASALYEMAVLNPKIRGRELFWAGIHVGQDMIGTMTNTLVLAFAGSSFVTMIVYAAYNMEWRQLLCNDYIVLELLQGLSGTMAIVCTVPIGAFVSAYLFSSNEKEQ